MIFLTKQSEESELSLAENLKKKKNRGILTLQYRPNTTQPEPALPRFRPSSASGGVLPWSCLGPFLLHGQENTSLEHCHNGHTHLVMYMKYTDSLPICGWRFTECILVFFFFLWNHHGSVTTERTRSRIQIEFPSHGRRFILSGHRFAK